MYHPNFNDVKNERLQTYNRLNIIYNIKEHLGNAHAVVYTRQFSKKAKIALLTMDKYIREVGYSTVRREIFASTN